MIRLKIPGHFILVKSYCQMSSRSPWCCLP